MVGLAGTIETDHHAPAPDRSYGSQFTKGVAQASRKNRAMPTAAELAFAVRGQPDWRRLCQILAIALESSSTENQSH
jgi:hypothetical protein